MERRPFLALLTAALAGCGASDQRSPESTETTPVPTRQPSERTPSTATTTATSTDTPTETPTETPSADVRRARQRLAEVTSTLDAAVEQYTDDAGETILATDASYLGFDSGEVVAAVEEAERELERASEAVVTDEQAATLANLETMKQFLRAATGTQTSLIDAYYHLREAREALASANDEAAEDAVVEMDAKRRIARGPYETIREETDASATDALSQLDAATYHRKREQFEAEIRAFGEIREPVDEFASAVGRLGTARALERNGSTEQARESARKTVRELDAAAASLATFTNELEPPADSLTAMCESLRDLAVERAEEVRDRFGVETEGTTTTTTTAA